MGWGGRVDERRWGEWIGECGEGGSGSGLGDNKQGAEGPQVRLRGNIKGLCPAVF